MIWYDILDKLSNSDITKFDTIENMPAVQVLNYLVFLKLKENE